MMTSTGLVAPPGRGSECREDICRSLFSLADTDGDGLVWRSVVSSQWSASVMVAAVW